MSNTVITRKVLHIPVPAILQAVDLLLKKEIIHEIVATDVEEEQLIIQVEYEKQERDTIHEIEDLIANYEEVEYEDDEEEDDE